MAMGTRTVRQRAGYGGNDDVAGVGRAVGDVTSIRSRALSLFFRKEVTDTISIAAEVERRNNGETQVNVETTCPAAAGDDEEKQMETTTTKRGEGSSVIVKMLQRGGGRKSAWRHVPVAGSESNLFRDDFQSMPSDVFHPDARFKILWDMVVAMLIIFSVTSVPFRIGYGRIARVGNWDYFLDWVVDCIFFVDIGVSFKTAFRDKSTRHLVCDRRKIAKNYLKGWFLLDLLSTLPFDKLDQIFSNLDSETLRAFKLVRILRLARLLKFIKLLKMDRLMKEFEHATQINTSVFKLVVMLAQVVFMCHILACLWHVIGCVPTDAGECTREQSWLTNYGIDGESVNSRYIASMYWTIATVTGVGYGDVYATGTDEYGYSIVVMIIGASLYGFAIGNIAKFLEGLDKLNSLKVKKMAAVNSYMTAVKLPKKLRMKVRAYYDHYLGHKSVFDEHDILSDLNATLRTHLVTHNYHEFIHKTRLFKYIHEADTKAGLCTKLKPLFCAEHETVHRQGTLGKELFFVFDGIVELRHTDPDVYNEPLILGIMTAGMQLCLPAVLNDKRNFTAAIAVSKVELFHLSRDDLNEIFDEKHTEDRLRLQNVATRESESLQTSKQTYATNLAEVQSAIASTVRESVMGSGDGDDKDKEDGGGLRKAELHRHSAVEAQEQARATRDTIMQIAGGGGGKHGSWRATNATRHRRKTSFIRSVRDQKSPEVAAAVTNLGSTVKLLVNHFLIPLEELADTLEQVSKHRGMISVRRPSQIPAIDPNKIAPLSSNAPRVKPVTAMADLDIAKVQAAAEKRPKRTLKSAAMALRTTQAMAKQQRAMDVFRETPEDMLRRGIIVPWLWWKVRWDMFVAFLIFFSVMYLPIKIGFSVPDSETSEAFDWFIDISFFTDMALTFRTAYYSIEDHKLVADGRLIANNYTKTWFAIDLFSTVPIDKIVSAMTSGDAGALRSLKLVRILRLIRLVKLVRLLKLKKLKESLDNVITLSPAAQKLIKLLGQVTLVAHMMACFFFFTATNACRSCDTCSDADRLTQRCNQCQPLQDNGFHCDEASWIRTTSPFWDLAVSPASLASQYTVSLYWSFMTMTTVGYGDVVPKSDNERVYVMCSMFLGASVFGYIVSSIVSIVENMGGGIAISTKERLENVSDYMEEQKLPMAMQNRIEEYYEQFLRHKSLFDVHKFLPDMSAHLRTEIVLYLHRDVLMKIPFLRDSDEEMVVYVLENCRPEFYTPGDFLFHEGDIGRDVFFLVKGSVDIVGKEGTEDEEVYTTLPEGNIFGEVALLMSNQRRTAGVRAKTWASLYVFQGVDIDKMTANYPEIAEQMKRLTTEAGLKIRRGEFQLPGDGMEPAGSFKRIARKCIQKSAGARLKELELDEKK